MGKTPVRGVVRDFSDAARDDLLNAIAAKEALDERCDLWIDESEIGLLKALGIHQKIKFHADTVKLFNDHLCKLKVDTAEKVNEIWADVEAAENEYTAKFEKHRDDLDTLAQQYKRLSECLCEVDGTHSLMLPSGVFKRALSTKLNKTYDEAYSELMANGKLNEEKLKELLGFGRGALSRPEMEAMLSVYGHLLEHDPENQLTDELRRFFGTMSITMNSWVWERTQFIEASAAVSKITGIKEDIELLERLTAKWMITPHYSQIEPKLKPSSDEQAINEYKREKRKFDEYWGDYIGSISTGCATACAAMALSSIKKEMKPKDVCINNLKRGSDPVYMQWGQQGASCFDTRLNVGFDFEQAMKNYTEHPEIYSYPIVQVPHRSHYVVVVGKNENGSYNVLDPENMNAGTTVKEELGGINDLVIQYYLDE